MAYGFSLLNIQQVRVISRWMMSKAEGKVDMSAYIKSYERGDKVLKGPGNCLGYAVLDEASQLIGLFEYYRRGKDFEIGLALTPALRGKGKGYAFIEAGILFGEKIFPEAHAVMLEVKKSNRVAIKLYRQLGFLEIKDLKSDIRMKKVLKKD
ncbi:GNAT family N-acetyltransferase [Fusibacter paucivorans]|uniref:GNAT family N-acetyltransferase n=1 Tax=Fusibacter paucivorans TaxID=76009 RepID=A0ABS5PSM5_9FIRM|nr:GNAT family N-acetyltransferase [Fusibacter paucivorans]MBS7527551.1 GNAT family N-acetyltransferase [Fusibacter paucivorans]